MHGNYKLYIFTQANKIKIFEYARREELELGQIFVIARLVEGGKPLSEAFEESKRNLKNKNITFVSGNFSELKEILKSKS